jgi:penicillin-insensitive murein endopeptidase
MHGRGSSFTLMLAVALALPFAVAGIVSPARAQSKLAIAEAEKNKPPKGQEDAAKYMFAAKRAPSPGPAEAIGYYPRGCLQGGVALPIDGPHWQVMRLFRNRNWGHPSLVRFIERFSERAAQATGWNGILVGDMAQPRGGPAPSGHVSHQTGLDVDIWFVPMPKERLTREERDEMSANNLVAADWKHVNPQVYTPQHMAFIKAAAQAPDVERVLVNAAIKKKMCETATGNRSWLAKVRPWYGHHDHIHVRLRCPHGDSACKKQPPVDGHEGCADSDFTFWFTKALEPKKPSTKPPSYLKLADLPAQCKAVLAAPDK